MRSNNLLQLQPLAIEGGFFREYADYENGDREQLIKQYPGAAELIKEYTR